MEIVESKAHGFIRWKLMEANDASDLLSDLRIELTKFNRDTDKLTYITTVSEYVRKEGDKHAKVCENPRTCPTSSLHNEAIFFIDQLMEEYSDQVIQDHGENEERNHGPVMSVKQKKKLLLHTLYDQGLNGKMYDIPELMAGHIRINRNEAYELAKALETEGYIKMSSTVAAVYAAITARGAESIEGDDEAVHLSYNPPDKFTSSEKYIIIQKLDELSERLTRLELGQQITYDDIQPEIDELKGLLVPLGKKHWLQVLKGKLLDAGLGTLSSEAYSQILRVFKDSNALNG